MKFVWVLLPPTLVNDQLAVEVRQKILWTELNRIRTHTTGGRGKKEKIKEAHFLPPAAKGAGQTVLQHN